MIETEDKNTQEYDTTYDHVIKYTGLFGGVQGVTMLISIVRNKLVSILLGPSGLALINIFNNVMRLINQSTNFGISFSAVRNIAELYETGDKEETERLIYIVRTWSVLTALFGIFVCMALAPIISFWTFENYQYTSAFMLLSPILGCLAITGGEAAILKGMKQLKKVALISVFGAAATLLICTPAYYLWGTDGIVVSLLLSNIAILAIHLHFSTKVAPWRCAFFSKAPIKNGLPMVKLGLAYIIAGIFGQGAEYIIRTSILKIGDLTDVGLYNSGYVMAVSYASLVFIAIEADYFPRLSAAEHDLTRQNATVNQQIEVCVLLISPFLILFVLAMPFIVMILFSNKFMEAVPMAVCATFYMFFKALTLPAAYLPLAKGDSKMYMTTELIYDIFIAATIPAAFYAWGLTGAGWALSAGGVLDFLLIHIIYRAKYKFKFSFRLIKFYILQMLLLGTTVYVCVMLSGCTKWVIGGTALAVSLFTSIRILKRETHLIESIRKKFREKAGKRRKN